MARQMKDSGIEWIGEIPETWDLVQLKRFATVNNGREIEAEVDGTAEGAIGVYGSGGVFKYTDRYMHDGVAVMFGRKGTLGKPLYVDNKFWVVDTMYYLTYTEALHPKFNYYQLMVFDWNPHITQTALGLDSAAEYDLLAKSSTSRISSIATSLLNRNRPFRTVRRILLSYSTMYHPSSRCHLFQSVSVYRDLTSYRYSLQLRDSSLS